MKISIMAIFLFSLSALAQVRTGGGGIIDENLTVVEEGEVSLSRPELMTTRTRNFIGKLSGQEKVCRSEGKRYLTIDMDYDFMKAYLKLSVLQSTFIADDKCQDVGAYFKCLYSPEVKEALQIVTKSKGMKKYLQKTYKIDKKEATEMLKFFDKLDKSCQKAECEM